MLCCDGTTKLAAEVRPGDLLWSPEGPSKVVFVDVSTLGNRKLLGEGEGKEKGREDNRRKKNVPTVTGPLSRIARTGLVC